MQIIDFRATVAASHDEPRPDRLLSPHSPQRITWEHYQSSDHALSCGIWACEPGEWRIRFAPDKHEFFCVISGLVRLHDEAGQSLTVGPGEAAVIPGGFAGRFEVVEAVRKYFVVYDSASAA
ncbi:cupin domain-containing protein [Chitinilyticum litopenaei]|uniref:cupin domain-containing protein n=1 Tax=Chitinilyticum litopenaei TaxID=1121276 RepID=UPI00041075AC|nr:cupin domain-containing protein [Chitinilyticum litopenaei]